MRGETTENLGHEYRPDEWAHWFAAAGQPVPLLPPLMFQPALRQERLVQPFDTGVSLGRYWLVRLKSRPASAAMQAFRAWLLDAVAQP